MIRSSTSLLLAALAGAGLSSPVQAAESYDNCSGFIDALPATIAGQGTWCLRGDLSTAMATGAAITIAANNVTIDCNHFKLGGLAAGSATTATGIQASSTRQNVAIRQCNIRGFRLGLMLGGGAGHLVEDNAFDGNTTAGMYVSGEGSLVRNNRVVDTGGSTVMSSAIGMQVSSGVDVIDNTISGVAPGNANGGATGIRASGPGSIRRNRVRRLAATGSGATFGIRAEGTGRRVMQDNHVQGPGPETSGSVGIDCFASAATARGNIVAGFETGIAGCLSNANAVNTN